MHPINVVFTITLQRHNIALRMNEPKQITNDQKEKHQQQQQRKHTHDLVAGDSSAFRSIAFVKKKLCTYVWMYKYMDTCKRTWVWTLYLQFTCKLLMWLLLLFLWISCLRALSLSLVSCNSCIVKLCLLSTVFFLHAFQPIFISPFACILNWLFFPNAVVCTTGVSVCPCFYIIRRAQHSNSHKQCGGVCFRSHSFQ